MKVKIHSVGKRGRQPIYQAKVGTLGSSGVIVKRARSFEAGQKIEYVQVSELEGQSVGCSPRWQHGLVTLVEDDRLFIDRH